MTPLASQDVIPLPAPPPVVDTLSALPLPILYLRLAPSKNNVSLLVSVGAPAGSPVCLSKTKPVGSINPATESFPSIFTSPKKFPLFPKILFVDISEPNVSQ